MSTIPEWMRRNHYQEEDPGTVWTKDEGVVIDVDAGRDPHRVLTPNAISLPEGGYRLYYYSGEPERRAQGVTGCIVSSFSEDGEAWTREPGLRVDAHAPDAENRTLCPDVVSLPQGGYRMYYQAHSATGRGVVLSSCSANGLDWTREEGVRFAVSNAVCGSPRCVPLEDGRWRLYCHEYPDEPTGTGIHTDNHVISAISADGLDWVRDEGICLDNGGPLQSQKVSEPCVVRLPDGRFRMFYEANDGGQEWRILCATTPGPSAT